MLGPDNYYSSKVGITHPVSNKELQSSTEQERVKPDPQHQSTRDFRKILEKKEMKSSTRKANVEKKRADPSETDRPESDESEIAEAGDVDTSLNETNSEWGQPDSPRDDLNFPPEELVADSKSTDNQVEESAEEPAEEPAETAESPKENESIFALKQQSKNQFVGRSQKTLEDPHPDATKLAEADEFNKATNVTALKSKQVTPVEPREAPVLNVQQAPPKESPFKVFKKISTENEGRVASKHGFKSLDKFNEKNPLSAKPEGVGLGMAVDANYANQNRTAFQETASIASTESVAPPPAMNTRDLQTLIDAMGKELSIVKQGDRTDTVITLKNVPHFEDAILTVSTNASAPKEFNIKFENLTQTAQRLIEENQAALKTSLKESYDVVIHMISASTYRMEQPVNVVQTETSPDKEKQGKDREQSGQQGRNPREQKG